MLNTFEVKDFATIDRDLITSDVCSDADIVNLVKHGNGTNEVENSNEEEEEQPYNLEIAAPIIIKEGDLSDLDPNFNSDNSEFGEDSGSSSDNSDAEIIQAEG
ncbi:hypothetical protein QE152_g8319 [Popillia japonica]|uniref:Uncharacterized protein n=1 Tax=Popillia japonica TaxID=7064 RepID=A0AAW1MBX9_POPJA